MCIILRNPNRTLTEERFCSSKALRLQRILLLITAESANYNHVRPMNLSQFCNIDGSYLRLMRLLPEKKDSESFGIHLRLFKSREKSSYVFMSSWGTSRAVKKKDRNQLSEIHYKDSGTIKGLSLHLLSILRLFCCLLIGHWVLL